VPEAEAAAAVRPEDLIEVRSEAPRRGRPSAQDDEVEKRTARNKLWAKGELRWKFEKRPWCRDLYDWIRAHWGAAGYLAAMMHRRAGKTSVAHVIAIEECLRAAGTSVAIICSTMQQARDISKAIMKPLLADCPKRLRPRFIKNDFAWEFDHNGSRIAILPADKTNWKNARGRKNTLVIVTEAGFVPGVDAIMAAILPTLRDVTDEWSGTMFMESTPPEEQDHPFQRLWEKADAAGRTFFLPLSANQYAGPKFRESAIIDSEGEDTVVYRREYELQFVFDEASTAIPEFTRMRAEVGDLERGLPRLVREVDRPSGADLYGSLDPGGSDMTAGLLAFYEFSQDLLVIEDELAMQNMTSDVLAARWREKERALWGENPAGKLMRFADNNNKILLGDLNRLHKLLFYATAKDNRDAQINQVRLMVRDGRLAIHPRCKLLIKTLRLARRAATASKGFQHSKEIGHADLLDALIYLVRNVRRNAMPGTTEVRPMAEQGIRPAQARRSSEQELARALGLGRRLR
jgi:hypothetical protein